MQVEFQSVGFETKTEQTEDIFHFEAHVTLLQFHNFCKRHWSMWICSSPSSARGFCCLLNPLVLVLKANQNRHKNCYTLRLIASSQLPQFHKFSKRPSWMDWCWFWNQNITDRRRVFHFEALSAVPQVLQEAFVSSWIHWGWFWSQTEQTEGMLPIWFHFEALCLLMASAVPQVLQEACKLNLLMLVLKPKQNSHKNCSTLRPMRRDASAEGPMFASPVMLSTKNQIGMKQ